MKRDKTRLDQFSDEELQAAVEGTRELLVKAELKLRFARQHIAMAEEELEFRRSGKPKQPAEEWENLWNKEAEDVAKTCGVSLGYVAEVALRLAKES